MKIILYQPQIPQNTGNIVRTCAVTGCELILVRPGFSTSNRWLKRAGLDYWEGVKVTIVDDLEPLLKQPFTFFSSKASRLYTEHRFQPTESLIFGSETEGLPESLWERWPDQFVTLPMRKEARCLNLATSVGIALYEAERQQNFTFFQRDSKETTRPS